MNPAFLLSGQRVTTKTWFALLICLYAGITCVSLLNYLHWSSPVFLLGVASMFFAGTVNKAHTGSGRYAYAAVFFSLLNLLLPVKTILFVSIACAVMFTIEDMVGRLGKLPVILTALMSPAFQYLSDVFTFPIRLELTAWAGKALHFSGSNVVTEGNIIICNGNEFSVDPACMGLNMMVTSLITGVVLIATYQYQLKKTIPAWVAMMILLSIGGLNILSNMFRILCLVQFSIMPQSWLHDCIGMVCFLAYVILPASFLCKWMTRNYGKSEITLVRSAKQPAYKTKTAFHCTVAGCILLSSFTTMTHNYSSDNPVRKAPVIQGYASHLVDENIIKLENAVSLVYIKKIPGFYAADHTPLICWRGSGYVFSRISEEDLHGTTVYSGILQKGDEQLYTIWWYANTQHVTTKQLEWRWDVLKGANNYSIVNITCSSEKLVKEEAEKILATHQFNKLLQ